MIRHNLDVMHIEKNVCDSIFGTLMESENKNKDGLKSRYDMKLLNIRHALHPIEIDNKILLPPSCFSLNKNEKVVICEILKGLKSPDGYASNISRCVSVRDRKISGLKTHDCHILLHQLVPVLFHVSMPDKNVRSTLTGFCMFFRDICSKEVDRKVLDILEEKVVLLLCQMEKIFPPSFF